MALPADSCESLAQRNVSYRHVVSAVCLPGLGKAVHSQSRLIIIIKSPARVPESITTPHLLKEVIRLALFGAEERCDVNAPENSPDFCPQAAGLSIISTVELTQPLLSTILPSTLCLI